MAKADPYGFTMGFVANSDRYRSQYVDGWQEALRNACVKPDYVGAGKTNSPYSKSGIYKSARNRIILKDPETHKMVWTYAAKLGKTLFGDSRGEYVQARPSGWEDAADKAPTVTRLLRYDFQLPGMFRTWIEAIVDMLIFGTSVVEVVWKYEAREMPVRTVNTQMGVDLDSFSRQIVPTYDDVAVRCLDVMDFYPDPSCPRLEEMYGAAKRFKMNALLATANGKSGLYKADKVRQAIAKGNSSMGREDSFRVGIDQPTDAYAQADFKEMVGYEYWGDVPWEDDYGTSRRVITVLNDIVVRDEPWPLSDPHLPFHGLVINPMQGRFYGLSPCESVKYDQSLADAIKILLAEAIIRQVHPPIAYDDSALSQAGALGALQAWKADALIGISGGPNSIGTLRYDANVQNGFAMLQGLKLSMQESSGALGAIQGENGPDRESATVGSKRYEMALDRPELAAMILEKDCLPGIGSAFLYRNQQFLDSDGLAMRIGEQPTPFLIDQIMGDFDVYFTGSRQIQSHQQRLQGWDRIVSMAASVPAFQMLLPTLQMMRRMIGDDMDMPDVAAQIGDPQQMMMNALAMQMGGGSGPAQNGVPPSGEPSGMLPAQSAGGFGA